MENPERDLVVAGDGMRGTMMLAYTSAPGYAAETSAQVLDIAGNGYRDLVTFETFR